MGGKQTGQQGSGGRVSGDVQAGACLDLAAAWYLPAVLHVLCCLPLTAQGYRSILPWQPSWCVADCCCSAWRLSCAWQLLVDRYAANMCADDTVRNLHPQLLKLQTFIQSQLTPAQRRQSLLAVSLTASVAVRVTVVPPAVTAAVRTYCRAAGVAAQFLLPYPYCTAAAVCTSAAFVLCPAAAVCNSAACELCPAAAVCTGAALELCPNSLANRLSAPCAARVAACACGSVHVTLMGLAEAAVKLVDAGQMMPAGADVKDTVPSTIACSVTATEMVEPVGAGFGVIVMAVMTGACTGCSRGQAGGCRQEIQGCCTLGCLA